MLLNELLKKDEVLSLDALINYWSKQDCIYRFPISLDEFFSKKMGKRFIKSKKRNNQIFLARISSSSGNISEPQFPTLSTVLAQPSAKNISQSKSNGVQDFFKLIA